MKKKDLVQLAIALVIFLIAGILIYLQVAPKNAPGKAAQTATIEVVTPVAPSYDQSALNNLSNASINRDFYSPPNLSSGIGNSQPFGTTP